MYNIKQVGPKPWQSWVPDFAHEILHGPTLMTNQGGNSKS